MNVLNVVTDDLVNYSNTLSSKAREFSTVRKKMIEIVNELNSGSWSGVDARTFISNATEYLDNLNVIEDCLYDHSGTVRRKASSYNRRCEDFYSKLRG